MGLISQDFIAKQYLGGSANDFFAPRRRSSCQNMGCVENKEKFVGQEHARIHKHKLELTLHVQENIQK